MRLTTPIFLFILSFAILFTACDQQMQKPVIDVISPPPTYVEMASETMERVNQRRITAQQNAAEAGDYSTILIASEIIFNEELGFRKGLWVDLVAIYRNENSNDTEIIDGFDKLQDAFASKLKEDTLGMFYFDYIRHYNELNNRSFIMPGSKV